MGKIGCAVRTSGIPTKPIPQPIGMHFVEGADFPLGSYGIHVTFPIKRPATF